MSKDSHKMNQLDKLQQLAPDPMNHDFITGYLTFGAPLSSVQQVKTIAEQILTMHFDKLITYFNVLELLVIVKYDVLKKMDEEVDRKSMAGLLEPFLTELVLDNTYLYKKYFQRGVNRSQIVSENLGIQCQICLVQINSSELCFLSCGHMIHRECFNEYAKQKISNKIIPFNCPIEECHNQLSSEELGEQLNKELRQKYQEFTFHNYVDNNMEDTSWCPTPGCSAVFAFDAALTEYRCPACGKHYCLACKCQFHTNLTCEEYKSMANLSEDDKNFMMCVKGAKCKQCPNCKFWVQKSTGCDHMTCRCKYEFCYICGGKYNRCKCQGFVNEVEEPRLRQLASVPPAEIVQLPRPRSLERQPEVRSRQRLEFLPYREEEERIGFRFQNKYTRPRRGQQLQQFRRQEDHRPVPVASINKPRVQRDRRVQYEKQQGQLIGRSVNVDSPSRKIPQVIVEAKRIAKFEQLRQEIMKRKEIAMQRIEQNWKRMEQERKIMKQERQKSREQEKREVEQRRKQAEGDQRRKEQLEEQFSIKYNYSFARQSPRFGKSHENDSIFNTHSNVLSEIREGIRQAKQNSQHLNLNSQKDYQLQEAIRLSLQEDKNNQQNTSQNTNTRTNPFIRANPFTSAKQLLQNKPASYFNQPKLSEMQYTPIGSIKSSNKYKFKRPSQQPKIQNELSFSNAMHRKQQYKRYEPMKIKIEEVKDQEKEKPKNVFAPYLSQIIKKD